MNLDERLQKDLSPDIYCLVHNKIVNLEQQCKKQKELCNRLISNWNKLKKYLTNRYNNGAESISYRQSFLEIIAIMQELEQGSDNNVKD